MKKRERHPEKCQRVVKESIISDNITITLSSHHGYEWNITISCGNSMTQSIFPDRISARKAFRTYGRQYKQLKNTRK